MAQTMTMGGAPTHASRPEQYHFRLEDPETGTGLGITDPSKEVQESEDHDTSLDFDDLPPFPSDVPTAPLLRISLSKLLKGDETEVDRLWKASCELGFFYLDLRSSDDADTTSGLRSPEAKELTSNVWDDIPEQPSPITRKASTSHDQHREVRIDGPQLLLDAAELFTIGAKVFALPIPEKQKYDFKARGSYYGYKGYGEGVIDAAGTRDRNEFYNVSKDDILGLSNPLPAPEVLYPHRPILKSYIEQSHAVVTLLLRLLNARLDLPPDTLPSKHRLYAASGDQVRFVRSPPQPVDDRKTALGEHTDFGSVTILFNRLGGLQVLPPGTQEWCYVKPLRHHAVVNLGDAMVKFTRGVLRSNIHRVVNPPGEQGDATRMSLVYFARPEDHVLLKPLEGSRVVDANKVDGEEDEEEITAKDWILRRALGRRTGGDWGKSGGTEQGRVGS
ncbi:hypothetical protein MBLNU457_7581t1 [Dothideomycetes sp. NU457]